MKKNYIIPAMKPLDYEVESMICAISSVGGNAGINLAGDEDEVPGEADVNANPFGDSIFD